ncbi:mevalonate kinase family protein [Larkinella rosea]|uniref:GHMP kinase n=1 Tax=Larkinella rosea TaxID=2025312 RepID=A0A3P1BRR7_9BACT|nr:galactokinase family protein [Larkinella rosea]RRB03762.1 GHMP kinase [Larkinella rosea]
MFLPLSISTPGRICLFGEHQDYLGLPVIAAAISKRIQITAEPTTKPEVRLFLPDIDAEERFSLRTFPLSYQHDRDYFRSAINVLLREGFRFSSGIQGEVRGNIPINSGTSSSSALLITWLAILSKLADNPQPLSPRQLAELAYRAEILEFGEPGGMMDHYATAVGGVIYLESKPAIHLESFQSQLGTFVLGDSRQPKDTIGVLRHVKFGMLGAMEKIRQYDPGFSLDSCPQEKVDEYRHLLTPDETVLLKGNLSDRDVLQEALTMFKTGIIDHQRLGALLTIHQTSLREAKRVSTPKIDRMIEEALKAGAYGGKINGSGGGGCMFAYAPENPEAVAEAIERAGGKAYIIQVDQGVSVQPQVQSVE